MTKIYIIDEYVFLLNYKQLYYIHNIVEQQYFNNGALVVVLIVSMRMNHNQKLVANVFYNGENVNAYHDCMCVHCAQSQHNYCFNGTFTHLNV